MTNSEIATRCYQAFASGDRSEFEAFLADDFHFTSPLDNAIDQEAYFRRCWPTHEFTTGFRLERVCESEDLVFVTYVGTRDSGEQFRNTEILKVADGRIQEVEVYFGWTVPHPAPTGCAVDPSTGEIVTP